MIEPSANPNAAQSRKLIVAGQIAFLPTGMLTTLLWPMLPILSSRWGLSDSQAGNLFLIQFLSQLAGVQASGVMLARVGFRPAFLSGLLLMAGGVGTLYLGAPWLGFVSVAVYGLGLGLIIPTDNLLIAEISSGSRAAAVSLLNFFWGVGAVLNSLLVGWAQAHHLVAVYLGSLSAFLVLMAFVVRNLAFPQAVEPSDPSTFWQALQKNPTIWLFAALLCIRLVQFDQVRQSTPKLLSGVLLCLVLLAIGIYRLVIALIPWSTLLRNPVIWMFSAAFFFYPGSETAVGGWIGSYVTRMGMKSAMGALMPALFLLALTAGRGVGGVFLRLLPEQRVLQAGYGLGVAGIGLLLASSALPGVIASAIIIGLSFATLYPITVARLSHRFGVQARSIGAVMFSIAALGPAFLPWLVGVISQSTGNLRAGLAVPLVSIAILFLIHLREW